MESVQDYGKYVFSRYEELSLGAKDVREKKLSDILEVLLPDNNNLEMDITKLGKFNASKANELNILQNYPGSIQGKIYEICAPLMEQFGYKNEL